MVTNHYCIALVPDGKFLYQFEEVQKRICGRPFCVRCCETWGLEGNRIRCNDHKDIGENDVAAPMFTNASFSSGNTSSPTGTSTTSPTSANDMQPDAAPENSTSNNPPNDNNQTSSNPDDDVDTTVDQFESYEIGNVYEQKAFVSGVRMAANRSGFEVAVRGKFICCSRAARRDDGPKEQARRASVPIEKKRKTSPLAVGCKWVIRWQPHVSMVTNPSEKYIRITSMHLEHTNGCIPSAQQLRVARRRSGTPTRAIPMNALKHIVQLLGDNERIPYSLVRKIIKPYFPSDWNMDSSVICNFLLKCRVFKKYMEERNDNIVASPNVPGWIQMANTDPADFVSKASRVAAQMLRETLENRQDMWEVEQYLINLKRVDRGFDYRIARQNDGKPTGVVWVTSEMRYNYEVAGFCLFLDAMKRQMNDIDWPYLSVVVLNNMKKVANACEAITCAEKIDAYR